MEFCPECKSLMVPEKKEDRKILRCRGCGFEKGVFSQEKYKLKKSDKKPKRDIIVVEEEDIKNKTDRRYLHDLYGDGLESGEED